MNHYGWTVCYGPEVTWNQTDMLYSSCVPLAHALTPLGSKMWLISLFLHEENSWQLPVSLSIFETVGHSQFSALRFSSDLEIWYRVFSHNIVNPVSWAHENQVFRYLCGKLIHTPNSVKKLQLWHKNLGCEDTICCLVCQWMSVFQSASLTFVPDKITAMWPLYLFGALSHN